MKEGEDLVTLPDSHTSVFLSLMGCRQLTSKSTFSPSGIFGAAMLDMNLFKRRKSSVGDLQEEFTHWAEEVNLLWLRLRLI